MKSVIDIVEQCLSTMVVIDKETIWRTYLIAPTVVVGFGFGYWMAIRGNDKDVRDLKEAAFIMLEHRG